MAHDYGLLSAYFALGVQALIPIALGSFKSLNTPATTLARRRKGPRALGEEREEEDENLEETLGWADSLAFPVLGSVALLGLWALLRYVGKYWINLVLGIYLSGAGMFSFQETFGSVITFLLRQTSHSTPTYHIRISSGLRQIYHLPMTLPSLLLLPIAILLPALYIPLGRPYILSNTLALCLSTTTLALLRLDSFFTAFLLLAVLLIYDIFWVFATPVMVTVAKGIDAPIKLLAAKDPFSTHPTDFAMLGLGDIVVPGLVIALCLRFDLARHATTHPKEDVTSRSTFGKAYWWVGMTSYVLGLGTTMAVMHWTRHAQPALLYLSPACIMGPVILALARGELKMLWSWSDAPDPSEEKTKLGETIETLSEVTAKAREAVKEDKVDEVAQQVAEHVEEDESWMEGPVDTVGSARKRRGGKKK